MNLPTKEELEDAADALRYVENTGRTEALLRAIADGRLYVCTRMYDAPYTRYYPATSIPDLP